MSACFSCGHVHRAAHLLELDLAAANERLEKARQLAYATMENVGTDAALARAVFCQDKLLPIFESENS